MYVLLYMEDTQSRRINTVALFSEEADALAEMENAYSRTIERLKFDTGSYSADHYCGRSESFAIIADGQDNYSWSVGVRKDPVDFLDIWKVLGCGTGGDAQEKRIFVRKHTIHNFYTWKGNNYD